MTYRPKSIRALELHTLQRYIVQKKLYSAPQRFTLLELVGRYEGPFDPQDLLDTIDRERINISRSTMYDTLELFVSAGILYRLPGSIRGSLLRCALCSDHTLWACRSCGHLQLRRSRVQMLSLQGVTPPGWRDTQPLLIYWGLCNSCLVQKES